MPSVRAASISSRAQSCTKCCVCIVQILTCDGHSLLETSWYDAQRAQHLTSPQQIPGQQPSGACIHDICNPEVQMTFKWWSRLQCTTMM